jgi:DNA-binding response OmpR family regulator
MANRIGGAGWYCGDNFRVPARRRLWQALGRAQAIASHRAVDSLPGADTSSKCGGLVELLLLTDDPHPESVLPALARLTHTVRCAPSEVSSLLNVRTAEVVVVDARIDLVAARGLCGLLKNAGTSVLVVAVLTEGGLVAVNPTWGVDEIFLPGAQAAEIDARLRLKVGRGVGRRGDLVAVRLGALVMDEGAYTARLRGRLIDLTFREFELLRYLAARPDRVFTRRQLLHEVWGYDYFGGTRTVDVHVRRLRAKLGEYQSLIATVHNVGYQAVRRNAGTPAPDSDLWRAVVHHSVRETG